MDPRVKGLGFRGTYSQIVLGAFNVPPRKFAGLHKHCMGIEEGVKPRRISRSLGQACI